jgi:uncharacterized protein DUF7007
VSFPSAVAGHAERVPGKGDESPWGQIDHVQSFPECPGLVLVGTPSHGGFYVPASLNTKIPARWRAYAARWSHGWGDQWYEEDCAAYAVCVFLLGREDLRDVLEGIEREYVSKAEVRS